MDFAKKQPGFMYLDKNGFYFFESGLTTVLSLAFSTASVRDMDVVNHASLIGQVQDFIGQYKLPPADFPIIFSPNITFEKDIVGQSQENTRIEIEKFTDTIPFENVLFRQYPVDKGVKVIACNDDMYREIKAGFEKAGSNVTGVVPYQMLGQDQELIKNLTIDSAIELVKKIDRLKNLSMIVATKEKPLINPASSDKRTVGQPKKINIRLFLMAGVFAILFVILGVMIVNM